VRRPAEAADERVPQPQQQPVGQAQQLALHPAFASCCALCIRYWTMEIREPTSEWNCLRVMLALWCLRPRYRPRRTNPVNPVVLRPSVRVYHMPVYRSLRIPCSRGRVTVAQTAPCRCSTLISAVMPYRASEATTATASNSAIDL